MSKVTGIRSSEVSVAMHASLHLSPVYNSGLSHNVCYVITFYIARSGDDQDAIWLRVDVAGSGASCHVGYRSCFYRAVPVGQDAGQPLKYLEDTKTFDPDQVYGDAPNPTRI
ncbi:hypothetical protein [Roseovarius atlanticus]|uniref:hypothetical protein n=1 Tax=Roseovarius atlanticus TaxID=1641875 RepID=UPI0028F6D14D|nr:hypothetical protein [Roseovarius atlanticus]